MPHFICFAFTKEATLYRDDKPCGVVYINDGKYYYTDSAFSPYEITRISDSELEFQCGFGLFTTCKSDGKNLELGKDNDLIWHFKEDMAFFKETTTGSSIIMGRKTFESLPKALPRRKNIVITKREDYKAEVR